jgi:hypothetical protein
MRRLSEADARDYLQRHGIVSPKKIDEILGGFDFSQAVYEQPLYPGDTLFQFVRLPSLGAPHPTTGNWFGIAGATTSGLAISDGHSGRRLHKYRVVAHATALEGSAVKKEMNWDWAGGGSGGATQLYVPPNLLGCIQAIGAHDRW